MHAHFTHPQTMSGCVSKIEDTIATRELKYHKLAALRSLIGVHVLCTCTLS